MAEIERDKPGIHEADTEEFDAIAPTIEFPVCEQVRSERGETEIHPGKAIAVLVAFVIAMIGTEVRWVGDVVAGALGLIFAALVLLVVAWILLKFFLSVTRA